MVVADVFSAFYSTGIPNIQTYVAVPPLLQTLLRVVRPFGGWLSSTPIRRVVDKLVTALLSGPTDGQRERTHTLVWGEVRDDEGNVQSMHLRISEAYTFTALSCLGAVERMRDGGCPAGYQTPSTAFGADFVAEIG
jgi:saccharopine dehydrogenase (NAD+, L-lysine-forming)